MNGNATVDNLKLVFGAGSDFEIFHDGTTNRFQSNGLKNFQFNPKDTDVGLKIIGDGACELYHDNGRKLLTASHGIIVEDDTPYVVIKDTANSSGNAVLGWLEAQNSSGGSMWKIGNTHNDQNTLWINQRQNASIKFTGAISGDTWEIYGNSGHFAPCSNNTFDIGTSTNRVRNIYTNDLNLSNEGSTNSVDNTWGDYTIQEGESDLFLINNRSGKKYVFLLKEVS